MHRIRIISFALLFCILILTFSVSFAQPELTQADIDKILWSYTIEDSIPTYNAYCSVWDDLKPDCEYVLAATAYTRYLENDMEVQPLIYTDFEGFEGSAVLTSENALIEYEVVIPIAGFYDLTLLYYPIKGKGAEIQRSFFLDGNLPYRELALIEFPRIWQNIKAANENRTSLHNLVWDQDNQGNDLRPLMRESPMWIKSYLYDTDGFQPGHLALYLSEGTHTISIHSLREPMLLGQVTLSNSPKTLPYTTQQAMCNDLDYEDTTGIFIEIPAESAIRVSSQMLYPTQDPSSPAVTPYSSKVLLNNTIGGNAWRFTGQWIEWEFMVPTNGYYQIGLNVKQNFHRGVNVSRKIMINGVTPFLEMEDYGFAYGQSWRHETLAAEGNPYRFYFEADKTHTIRIQAVLGGLSEAISMVRDSIYDLNRIYRKVIRLTGVKPDKYRDYQVERSLPELNNELVIVRNRISHAIDTLRNIEGSRDERERVLVTMRDQLDELIKNGERFPLILESFKVNIRACGTWLNDSMLQPLQLDAIQVFSPDITPKLPRSSGIEQFLFEIERLYYSFIIDYNLIGNISESRSSDTIVLWVGSGRDQANILKALIDESFTPSFNINVNVMLVDMGTLLQATLAGQGPDVALQVGNDLPMNYGLRNAVADLSVYEDMSIVRERFSPSAMVPFEFNGATYALPETQVFPMMFYRKDILYELELSLPETWDDVKVAMAVLSQNMMEFGMLPSEQIFAMLLYQNDGEYYNHNATRSALDSEQAINAFKIYTEFYTDYKLDRATSVEERFRTGETPLIIADYTTFNNLQVSAPDLKGTWGFAPVPGTVKADGSIDRTVASYGGALTGNTSSGSQVNNAGACVIMNTSKKKEASWEFIKWWTSAEIQTRFGREMESLMGSSARVPTANLEAFTMLPWSVTDYKALNIQFHSTKGIPQVPGGYFTYRNINNAFYAVTTPSTERSSWSKAIISAREVLMDKVILINDEIRYKRVEFGLPLE